MTNETRDRRCPLRVVVSASERSRIQERARSAGLSVSAYLRTAGLCHPIPSTFDHAAVVELAPIHRHQARNPRSRSDKGYPLVVSFPEGEGPTREQLADIEDRLCGALGFAEHQRVSAVHQNTDNWHMHIAINKVPPRTFRNMEPFRDHFRLQEACAELEVKHGLIRDSHTPEPHRESKARGKATDFEADQGYPAFLQWVRENAGSAWLGAR